MRVRCGVKGAVDTKRRGGKVHIALVISFFLKCATNGGYEVGSVVSVPFPSVAIRTVNFPFPEESVGMSKSCERTVGLVLPRRASLYIRLHVASLESVVCGDYYLSRFVVSRSTTERFALDAGCVMCTRASPASWLNPWLGGEDDNVDSLVPNSVVGIESASRLAGPMADQAASWSVSASSGALRNAW